MTIADLFVKVDPYAVGEGRNAAGGTTDGAAAAAPRTVEERKAQMSAQTLPAYTNVRLPGALLATHYAIRGGAAGASAGLLAGAVAAGLGRLEHGLLAGGGRLGFLGMCGGGVVGLGMVLAEAATNPDMDATGISRRANDLMVNALEAKVDKWTLGGAMGAAMAGFQAKAPLDASKCVPWGVTAALVAVAVTEYIDQQVVENRRRRQQEQ